MEEHEDTSNEILEKLSQFTIDESKQNDIINQLEYEYAYKNSVVIPTKTSVTEIKTMKNANQEKIEDYKIEMPKPKFLQIDKDIKITNAEKGTLIHLCMQKLHLMI